MYILIGVYIVLSPIFNSVYSLCGIYTFFAIGIATVIVSLLALVFVKFKANTYLTLGYLVGLLSYIIFTTAYTVNNYLYHGKYIFQILLLVYFSAVIGVFVKASSVRFSFNIYAVIALILTAGIILLCIDSFSLTNILPLKQIALTDFLMGCIYSVFALSVLLLPILLNTNTISVRYVSITSICIMLISLVCMCIAPSFIIDESNNIVIELSRSITIGRFFQRMEFVSVLVFTIVSMLMCVYITSLIFDAIKSKIINNKKRYCLVLALLIGVGAVNLLSVNNYILIWAMFYVALGTLGLNLLITLIKRKTLNRVASICMMLAVCFSISSCVDYNEIDMFEYPMIACAESDSDGGVNFTFISGSGTNSAKAKGIKDAKDAVNISRTKQIDLSQLSIVVVPENSVNLIENVVLEAKDSDIYNSVIVAVTSDEISELAKTEFKDYSGLSEFINEFKSKTAKYELLDTSAHEVYITMNKLTGAYLLPKVSSDENGFSFAGAVSYGKGSSVELSANEVSVINQYKQSLKTDWQIVNKENGSELRIILPNAKDKALNPQAISAIENLYNSTGFDALEVYEKIAVKSITEKKYNETISNINNVVVESKRM